MRIFALAALVTIALPAHAAKVGVYLEAGPGETWMHGADRKDRSWTPLIPRFGVVGDDTETGFFVDGEMTLLLFGAVAIIDELAGNDAANGAGVNIAYPGAAEEATLALQVAHMLRLRGGGQTQLEGSGGFGVGMNVDVDMAIVNAVAPGIVVNQQYGAPYLGLGLGPTLSYVPMRTLRLYLSPGVSAMLGDSKNVVIGYAIYAPLDIYFEIVPKFLDVKGRVDFERRSFSIGKSTGTGADFTTVSATVGVVGGLGWLFEGGGT